ncbi:hypothetical protein LJB83_01390 [Clostridia bacterium OttesenSCG-928-F22]|nr:hypothetical protein [Clostridia bacterium OttesenSCG-928-F22]
MNCEFDYCIYNNDHNCILETIKINGYGMCEACTLPSIPHKDLQHIKEKQLKALEKSEKGASD